MNQAGQTIALCMIVKNEHHVLRRCIDSARPLLDAWLIIDTGSTDGTQDLARELLRDVPGELVERPWRNFGHNRSEAVTLASGRADYLLLLDADEYLAVECDFCLPNLDRDAYDFTVDYAGVKYTRVQLVRSALPWRYEGVLHEYITCCTDHSRARMPGVQTIVLREGARSRDPLTYQKDALVLEKALLDEPHNERYMFYLAQSYRDAGELDLAIDRYTRRAAMGGFPEEAWTAFYEIAKLMEAKGIAWPMVIDAYLTAYSQRPGRAEPLYRVGIYYQGRHNFVLARLFLGQAMSISYPEQDVLFVESDLYHFQIPLEYAVACYWLGLHQEAMTVTDRLLQNRQCEDRREHLLRNRQFSVDALRAQGISCTPPPKPLR